MPRILAFAGSARRDSVNRKLITLASGMADATLLELADYPLPLYNADLEAEEGVPANARALQAIFLQHDALLLACPEYNGSITPLLKNTLDWVSRPAPGLKSLAAFEGKVAALLAASPGSLGGLRGLVHVRAILSGIGVLVMPRQLAVPRAHEGIDDATQARLRGVVDALVDTVARLHA